jgi:cytidyltransferase-like protein
MALQNLKTYFESANINDFQDLLKNPCVVTEKIQASSFHVKRTDEKFEYFKSGQKQAMDKVDRTIVKYYENAINYFNTLPSAIREKMPVDWKFGFDYMIDPKTVDIEYDNLPKNSLVLTHIQVLSPVDPAQVKKVIRDPQVLQSWAETLDVQQPPVLHQGVLHSDQKDELINLLSMSVDAFSREYTSKSFARKVYGIFNKGLATSALNTDLDKPIDSLILNFFDGKSHKMFKLERFDKKQPEDRKPSDMYQISILDLVEFTSQYDLSKVELKAEKPDERYIEMISIIFNAYVEKNATKYVGASFDSADFASATGFELNTRFIQNEKTVSLVQNKVLAELFKIILGSFRKKRTKETAIINADLMSQINEIVDEIEALIMGEIKEGDVMNFQTYLKNQNLKVQSSPILEGLKVDYPEQGGTPVNMFVGRFQPFTLGHAKVIETISSQNGYPVVIFLVKSKTAKKEDAFKRPYDESLQMEMLNKLKRAYPIEKVYVIDRGAIDLMFNTMRKDGYEPVLWGTGTDRLQTYSYQVDKKEYREDLGVRADFGLYEIPRDDNAISATQVRNAMIDGDESLFKKLTPKPIHGMYKVLKSKLDASMATNESKFLTFNDFLKNI